MILSGLFKNKRKKNRQPQWPLFYGNKKIKWEKVYDRIYQEISMIKIDYQNKYITFVNQVNSK